MKPRVVCDTNVVVSALLFPRGGLTWLRDAWMAGRMTPLVSRATTDELVRVLDYPKFRLAPEERAELLGDYLPYAETVSMPNPPPSVPACNDPDDCKFLELAAVAEADWLVTGDAALQAVQNQTAYEIITPARARELMKV